MTNIKPLSAGHGPCLYKSEERDIGRIDDFIAEQPYSWLREQCELFQSQNRLRGWRRTRLFSTWLRDMVEDQLIVDDYRTSQGYY